MKPFKLCICFIFFFGICCGVQKDIQMQVNYTDQNNNRYLITETTFNYIPITEKESSSGTYQGGESVSKTITTEKFKGILKLAEEIVTSFPKDVKREMMTSILSVSHNGAMESVTLRKSDKRSELESLLLVLKKTSE